ncbi:adenylosuccinate lyase [Kosmotoga pacifica]|uniref:Adenylosuccinate lyase n=1 Tax=Kosmotoga pacifica TaxID=1330330 RepID=A0A0G2ZG60_9BACT|nr:adenylosuccinate lyase [Kosmotoga pacifica]AKI97798.1 adenylosuccinate lyase [Kosmotoga pacifica]
MIERYALSPIKEIWEEEEKYKRWLEVELAVIEAFEKLGEAPAGTADTIRRKAVIDVGRIQVIEAEVDHDVIAFIKAVTERLGDEGRYFHKGLTSSDVVDTALSLALKRAGELIAQELRRLIEDLREKALKHRNTVIMGRTHGVHAEPTSFGLKMLSFLAEAERNLDRLENCIENLSVGKISGAVGNYANVSPEVEMFALERLGLRPAKVSTQVIPRDLHADFLNALALIGSGIERIAVEIRHLQKTEVLEVQEPFREKQRGSSAMPHKKNPILAERLSGMARMLRSYVIVGYENIVLWHERDISHSSTERLILPDATMLTFYMLRKATYLVENLVVYPERMLQNFVHSRNLVFSQRVMLTLVEKGLSREDAYKIVQALAEKTWREGVDFKKVVSNNPEIKKLLSEAELDRLFDASYYLRNIDEIFKRFDL